MRSILFSVAVLALAGLYLTGCGHDHDHPAAEVRVGERGGSILETEHPNLLVEYVHDPAQARIVLYLLDGQQQPLAAPPQEPPVVNLIADGRPEQLTTEPLADTPTAFQATHEAFRTENYRARANVFVGDRVYAVELIDDHHHHHH